MQHFNLQFAISTGLSSGYSTSHPAPCYVPARAVETGPNAWDPAPKWETQIKLLAAALGLAQARWSFRREPLGEGRAISLVLPLKYPHTQTLNILDSISSRVKKSKHELRSLASILSYKRGHFYVCFYLVHKETSLWKSTDIHSIQSNLVSEVKKNA